MRDESCNAASGPDEVLKLAHIVTTKPQSRHGQGVQVPCTLELPRHGVTPRSERLVVFAFPRRRDGYLANGRDLMARLSAPQIRGYIQGPCRNLSPSNPCSGRYLLLLFPFDFHVSPAIQFFLIIRRSGLPRALSHSRFVLPSAHTAFASSGLPTSRAASWKASRSLHTR